ncbi:MAG: hypothetical protein IKA52_02300 [Bacteroidaceae bacterium]|nr:hypothetical protein [Bacteroidaceae bacterium]
MIFENSDNKKKSTKNEGMDYPSFGDNSDLGGLESGESVSNGITPEWDAMKRRTQEKLNYLSTPVDTKRQELRYRNSFANYMMPKDTPERHRRNYALSNGALEDVTSGYYNNTLKGAFNQKREEAKQKGREEYMKNVAVPGADPVNAFNASMRADDPMRVVDETMKSIKDDDLMKQVAPLASYGGYDAKEYVDNFVKPSLREKMIKEYVDENTPKSSTEYVMRSAFDNSLMGKVGAMGMLGDESARNNRMVATEGLANYDANRLENFAAGVGSLLVDAPAFSGFGALSNSVVGGGTAKAMEKISGKVLSRYKDRLVSKDFADGVARKVVVDRLKNRIMQGAATQGLTLGGYDVANSVADDILYNGTVDAGKAASAFAKGFATGAAAGAAGTAIKARTKGLTGGKKLLSSAGVLSAESAVFTAGAELDKLAHGVEVKPIDLLYDYGESAATLLTMKMTNWRPKGAMQKLDAKGKLKAGLKLSESEKQELRESNVNPEQFVSMIEKELRMPSLGSADAKLLKENYAVLMSNKNLSASAKSKLMYLVENKITSTPPVVFDYDVTQNENGTWDIRMLDAGGGLVEKLNFKTPGNAKSHLILQRGGIRKNRIAHYERELTSGIDSQNFLHEAGLYAKENGVDADVVAEAMYKSARNEQLSNAEQRIMDDIMLRSSQSESQISKTLSDARREIEERYNLDKGTLSHAVDKRFIECSTSENKALDEYEAFVRAELEKSKNRETATLTGDASGMSNEDMKNLEAEEYRRAQDSKHAGQGGTESKQSEEVELIREIPENKPGYVWNVAERELTKETVEEFEKHGKELAKKFGQDIVFITDEHQIQKPDGDNIAAVKEYNNQLRASGWVHRGKVYINLPNIKDHADLESSIVHEVVGHIGLKKVFGRYMYDFIEDVYKTSDGSVRHGINKMRDSYHGVDMYTATEEYLASLVEKAYPTAQERNVLMKFKDFIKGMLIRQNIYKPKYRRVSEKDLQSIMAAHCRYVSNKSNLSKHRNDVFNRFKSAHLDEDVYNDPEAYARKKREMIEEGNYMKWTPSKFEDAKKLVNYPFLPEEMQKEVMKESKMSDEALREQSEAANYRFEGKKGRKNNADRYMENTENGIKAAEALEMFRISPREIKKKTGWERGADGEWRYEVGENYRLARDYVYAALFDNKPELAELYREIKRVPYEAWGEKEQSAWEKVMREGERYMKKPLLQDIVGDHEFFYSYPELVAMPVKIVEDAPALARYDSKNQEFVLDRNFFLAPDADKHLASALQNVIQEYEGFGKAVSLRLLSLEGRLANSYRNAQKCIALVDGVRKNVPSFDKNGQIERAFEREFGMDINTFKKRFPKYDDFLFYKLTGNNSSFSGNVEMDNVRKRYDMTDEERSRSLAKSTELVPRERQIVIKNLKDLEKYFNGPLDVINGYMKEIQSDEPIKMRKLGQRLNKANLTPVELAVFDEELDRYTKHLLIELMKERDGLNNPRGHDGKKSNRPMYRFFEEYLRKGDDIWNEIRENLDKKN